MLENSNSLNKFSNLDRLTFRNTRPVFLGVSKAKELPSKSLGAIIKRQSSADEC